jgi:hypothetical protein
MATAKTFRDLEVWKIAFKAAQEIFRLSKDFPKEERYSLTDQVRSWLAHTLRCEYITAVDFRSLDSEYQKIGGKLSRMIDRADDFCKFAPATDYRSISTKPASND